MKKALVLFPLLLLLTPALGVKVVTHDIEITINPDDSGIVREKYMLEFNSPEDQDKQALIELTKKEGLRVDDLKNFGIEKSVILPSEEESIAPTITQADIAFIEIWYKIPLLAQVVEEKGGKEIKGVTEKIFSFYDKEAKTISLPVKPLTTLTIKVPSSLKVIEEMVEPPQYHKEDGKEYTIYRWSASEYPFTNAEKLRVVYEKDVPVKSRLSLSVILTEIVNKYLQNPVYLTIIVIVLILLVIYRKEAWALISEALAGEETIKEEE